MTIKLYTRYTTPEVRVGNIHIGGEQGLVIQSMTNTDTNDITASIEQCVRIFDAGAHAVRLTTQGIKEAESLALIKQGLRERGYTNPIIADIHFNPKAALLSAQYVEKVRINPGNYVSSATKFSWTDEEYRQELQKITDNLIPLITVCKKYKTTIRVGVNHGSLSQRIIAKYGDTPEGMVESMMEFLRIFKSEGFHNVVCSVKSSNTRTMVYSYRLLAATMQQENCIYPLHLGVTEAGADEDGRIKSAVGIGTLLLDGIGDTIRVSLTEAPEKEIPVCKEICSYREAIFDAAQHLTRKPDIRSSLFGYAKQTSLNVCGIGGQIPPLVFAYNNGTKADMYIDSDMLCFAHTNTRIPIVSLAEYSTYKKEDAVVLLLSHEQISDLEGVEIQKHTIILYSYQGYFFSQAVQDLYRQLYTQAHVPPVLFCVRYSKISREQMQIRAAMDLGSVFLDGFGDGICIVHDASTEQEQVETSFAILQASRARFTKTEYIACPSCGRTLFNIEQALRNVKEKTSHLTGLKIAVMGCIVNGPGEMADADYGYVGAGRGMVHLYKKQEAVLKNIPEEQAVQALLDLITSTKE